MLLYIILMYLLIYLLIFGGAINTYECLFETFEWIYSKTVALLLFCQCFCLLFILIFLINFFCQYFVCPCLCVLFSSVFASSFSNFFCALGFYLKLNFDFCLSFDGLDCVFGPQFRLRSTSASHKNYISNYIPLNYNSCEWE